MIIHIPGKGEIPFGESNEDRPLFGDRTDEQLLALRARYKKYEKAIFSDSWQPPSLERFQHTCAALCLALDVATKSKDADAVYCPWFFEAFNTLNARIIQIPKDFPRGEEFYKWTAGIREIVEGTCAAFGCFGDSVVQYINAVHPDALHSSLKLVKGMREILGCFFEIENPEEKDLFVTAAFHLLYGYDEHGYPRLEKKVLANLAGACITTGWPGKIRTKEDMPSVVSNITSDELCSLMGIKMPSPEEKERIEQELIEESALADLTNSCEGAEKFFNSPEWFKSPDAAIGMWRIAKLAGKVARKAIAHRDFYYNKSSNAPAIPLSRDVCGDRDDDLIPVIKSFTHGFQQQLAHTQSDFDLKDLLLPMMHLNGALEALFHYLDKLPHDRHLSAARRHFDEWYDVLAGIVRQLVAPADGCAALINRMDLFCEELRMSGDILNERECEVYDKRTFQEAASAPKLEFTAEKMFAGGKDINYVAYLESVMSACKNAYVQFGEDVTAWPRQVLPYAATMELLLAIDASERLKERLSGHDVPRSEFPPLHTMLDPREGNFLKIMKRICDVFPVLTDEEYTEELYEQLFSVGFMAEFYFGLSTTEQGVRLLPDWKRFWFRTFTDVFCSPQKKERPRVSHEQTIAAYKELETCCENLSREASIQNSNLMRMLASSGKLPPGNTSFGAAQTDLKNTFDKQDAADILIARMTEAFRANPPEVVVAGFTKKGRRDAIDIANTKKAESDWFSDPNLCLLFDVSENTPYNWRKGKSPPEGFLDAFERKDAKAMRLCAEKYKATHGKSDAMNIKSLDHNLSEEQIYRQRIRRTDSPQ